MRKYIERILLILCAAVMIPFQVSAAEQEKVQLKIEGGQAEVSMTLPESISKNVLSLQLGMKIESTVQEKTKVEFQFPENVAKIAEYRYDEITGVLNLYLSGTESLFRDGRNPIVLGDLLVSTSNQDGATVKVSIIEDSVKIVEGMQTKVFSNMEYPEATEMVLGNGGTPGGGDEGQDNENEDQGNTEVVPDKKELQKVIGEAKAYKESEYTRESYDALKKAIANAEAVLGKEDATEEEIAEAVKVVENAIGALVKKTETSVPNTGKDPENESDNGQNSTEDAENDTVKTGDDHVVFPFVIAIIASVGVIVFIVNRKIYHKSK